MRTYQHLLSTILLLLLVHLPRTTWSQECALDIGVNMAGMADFATELPFVDLMRNARTWYTRDVDNPNAAYTSELENTLSYRADGYPTHIPQTVTESAFAQRVATIWDGTTSWPAGEYVVLWEGTGTISMNGTIQNTTQTGSNRLTFDLNNPFEGVVELTIAASDINDPIHNIRVLMPGTENTYESQPFNTTWLDLVLQFGTVRFMDWGQTNNWGHRDNWLTPDLVDWDERSRMDYYTWAYEKGVPYEMMVKLMNDYNLDGWVCVPHRASDDYIREMAIYFKENLESDRLLTVEYSNEIWNFIFQHTHWLNEFGCLQTGQPWPQGMVPYIQNCLDIFASIFSEQRSRIRLVVGAFTGWTDVTRQIVEAMTPGSFDAIACTFYFGLSEDADAALDALGASTTVQDVATHARNGMTEALMYIQEHKHDLADPMGVDLAFYEGGQHLTPHPFGTEPSYAQALLSIQRDPVMYDLYNDWLDMLRPLQEGNQPLQLMHFGLVAPRSPQFGSWGLLETMDTGALPAPKWDAVMDNQGHEDCNTVLSVSMGDYRVDARDCKAYLSWETLQESETAYFLIERSGGDGQYQEVGRLAAAGYSDAKLNYAFTDTPNHNDLYYYRIWEIDTDGKHVLLATEQVRLHCQDEQELTVFPNPIVEYVEVYGPVDDAYTTWRIVDINGKVLQTGSWQGQHNGEGWLHVDVKALPAGMYLVQVLGAGQQWLQQRVVKQ